MNLAETAPFLANPPQKGQLPIEIESLGRCAYVPVLERMRAYTDARGPQSADQIWLVEHEPVFTLGQAGKMEHLLDPLTSIPVVKVERGGQITYHAPGQIIAYTLIDLRRRDIKVREFVCLIEAAVIDTLAAYNLAGFRKTGAPGIYLNWQGEVAKVAALGLKVRNGATFHGVALNVQMDLAPFDLINPCGYAGLKTVDLSTLGVKVSVNETGQRLARALVERIERKDSA